MSYVLIAVLMCLNPVVHALASSQMATAQQLAGEDTMMVCTGKGMVYIDQALYFETGEVRYVELEHADDGDELKMKPMTGCELGQFSKVSTIDPVIPQITIQEIAYVEQVRARESRAVQTFAYLPSNPRAPPSKR
ncbi:DUF2946 family protein [Alteromonas facilis]|uniref:DUF2946 family protein n=1 Tax=Alteromonas facilis TaxID=2048004 RepID=UPI000C291036|nr:DUF2946 family protein [Alteromonas facilis]